MNTIKKHFPHLGLVFDGLYQLKGIENDPHRVYPKIASTLTDDVRRDTLLTDAELEALQLRVLAHLQAAEDELVAHTRPKAPTDPTRRGAVTASNTCSPSTAG
jgi:hypothetical protein